MIQTQFPIKDLDLTSQDAFSPINIQESACFPSSFPQFLLQFQHFLRYLAKSFPIGLNIIRFDQFLSEFLSHYTLDNLSELLWGAFNNDLFKQGIVLQLSLEANLTDINPLFEIYYQSLQLPISQWSDLPILQIHLPKAKIKEILNHNQFDRLSKQLQLVLSLALFHQVNLDQYCQWGNPDIQEISTSLQIPVCFDFEYYLIFANYS